MPAQPKPPSVLEQQLLEYINRLRLDPAGEFDRLILNEDTGQGVTPDITRALEFFGTSATAFRQQMEQLSPVAPIAWNDALARGASLHNGMMIEADQQAHVFPGGPSLSDRVNDAGYENWSNIGENVFAYALDVLYGHAGFVINWGYDAEDFDSAGQLRPDWQNLGDGIQDPPNHRNSLMNPVYREIGLAVETDNNPDTSVGPYVITQKFGARRDVDPILLGVVIDDANGNGFYDMGEGLGGVTVTASGSAGVFSTMSWESGGYQIALPEGAYTVRFEGGPLTGAIVEQITISDANLKLDVLAQDAAGLDQWLVGSLNQIDDLVGGRGNDMLFGDGFFAAYELDLGRAVYRLYQATLGREPDTAGQAGWTEQLANGTATLESVAAGFVGSREFQTAYGGLDTAGFVTLLYQNVLGRDPDAGGLAGWVDALEAGRSQAQVVLGFSNSAEFVAATNPAATAFTLARNPAEWQGDVYRLYQATLGREPDLSGFQGWLAALSDGTPFLTAVTGFVQSREFQNTYGALDDAGFVSLLYQNVLGRDPDEAGLAGWVAEIESGASRAEVVRGFAQSAEFIRDTAPALRDWIRAQGVDDILDGGSGMNGLWGGPMADVFHFARENAGMHHVNDLAPWDFLQFCGFGFERAEDVLRHMSQQGADVVFADQGSIVTLRDTELSTLDTDMFVFN